MKIQIIQKKKKKLFEIKENDMPFELFIITFYIYFYYLFYRTYNTNIDIVNVIYLWDHQTTASTQNQKKWINK